MVGGSSPRDETLYPGESKAFSFTVHLEGGMAQYGPDIRRFVEAMVYKLEKNLPKGKWEGLHIGQAFDLLVGEVEELRDELITNRDDMMRASAYSRNMVKTLLECADVANFALIIAAIAMERGR